ncbi:PAS domain-containing sensor histidine kinase [Peribacillus cavernae]|uniref:histidine kinase n=1 Tax=Peribacillus cavernae TaxID=1674310 RepID=A0A3S0W2M5_9BACI|nr:PAS domain-containing sensor histidine kinase [Peribacillus cavernae]MDQ0219733.1 PAS domain S-box-containing protein [Peribacillus cavernae]RUQ25154.1 PAS domain-containing sensor histidine kinase [Peribacillus cavernae]
MSKLKVLIIYTISGILWVFATDILMEMYIKDYEVIMMIEKAKGLFFILFTGLLLYLFLTKREKLTKLDEEERRLHTLINSMVDFVNFKDGDGRWIQSNEYGLKLFQLENVDYKGKRDSELANYSSFYREALSYCEISDEETWKKETITRCEEIIPLPNGDYKTFDTIKVPLFHHDRSRKGLVVIGRDITERAEAERKLSESKQQYKSLFDYNPDPVYMMDLKGIITNVNPQFESVMGLPHDELIGTSVNDFIFQAQEEKEKLKESFTHVINEKTGMNTGDIGFRTRDGNIHFFSCTFVPMLIDNQIVGIISYAKDVTHIRETEKILRKAEKLSVVGELAASVAHEVRNPLTSLKGFVQLLKDNESQYQHYYSIMLNELDRINQIVSELLMLAKPQEMQFKKHNLIHLMTEVKALLEPQANYYGAQILMDAHNQLPLVSCEANQLKQVFINIIKNSIEASSQNIQIKFEREDKSISIIMKDDGCGIDESRVKHLGEPFYSSKEKGTGLGLTVTYRIIEAHHGKLIINSEVGTGTEVKIVLPIS